MSALVPIPQDCVTQGNVTPAMRQWMVNALADAIGFDNAILALQSSRAPRNVLLNGDFAVWQRGGAAFSSTTPIYTADRWEVGRAGNVAGLSLSKQPGPTPPQWCALMQRVAANTGTQALFIGQSLETVDSIPLAGQTVTLSFMARAGANYSGGLLNGQVQTGTGTDESIFRVGGYTGVAAPVSGTFTLTTSWQSFSVTGAMASNANEAGVLFFYTPSGTAGASDWVEITAVQLEIGSEATAFDYRPFGEQLARCMRYYQKSFPYATTPAQNIGSSGCAMFIANKAGVSPVDCSFVYPVPMRKSPTMTYFNPSAANAFIRNLDKGTDSTTATSSGFSSEKTFAVEGTGLAAWVIGDRLMVNWTADAEL